MKTVTYNATKSPSAENMNHRFCGDKTKVDRGWHENYGVGYTIKKILTGNSNLLVYKRVHVYWEQQLYCVPENRMFMLAAAAILETLKGEYIEYAMDKNGKIYGGYIVRTHPITYKDDVIYTMMFDHDTWSIVSLDQAPNKMKEIMEREKRRWI